MINSEFQIARVAVFRKLVYECRATFLRVVFVEEWIYEFQIEYYELHSCFTSWNQKIVILKSKFCELKIYLTSWKFFMRVALISRYTFSLLGTLYKQLKAEIWL